MAQPNWIPAAMDATATIFLIGLGPPGCDVTSKEETTLLLLLLFLVGDEVSMVKDTERKRRRKRKREREK